MSMFPPSPEVTTDHSILEPEETLSISIVYTLHFIKEEIDTQRKQMIWLA